MICFPNGRYEVQYHDGEDWTAVLRASGDAARFTTESEAVDPMAEHGRGNRTSLHVRDRAPDQPVATRIVDR